MNDKILPTKEYSVTVNKAAFPKPFYQGLEFNAPAHGNWNIVHIGMLLPEARQIYVCADNCMRGVVLTAAEMNAEDRFSFVLLDENDMTVGNLEEVTIEGVSECIERLSSHPPVVLLFTVCVHHFLGCDLDYIYKKLGERYPDIFFARCYMDPLLQKTKPTPDQKLRLAMYDPIRPLPVSRSTVSLIGSEIPLYKSSDLYKIIELVSGKPALNADSVRYNPVLEGLAPEYFSDSAHSMTGCMPSGINTDDSDKSPEKHECGNDSYRIELKEISTCTSYDEYLSMGKSAFFTADFPGAVMGAEHLAKRLGRPFLYLPMSFEYDEISKLRQDFASALTEYCIIGKNISDEDDGGFAEAMKKRVAFDAAGCEAQCEKALSELKSLIQDTEIRIDYVFHPRPLGLAKLLISHGFNVSTVYIDVIGSEDERAFVWLKENAPDLKLCSTVQVEARIIKRDRPDVLAIGQKAAWFSGTKHFVNAVYGAGLWGFDGILRLCSLMEQAYREEKNTEDLITRKGWGCASCV